MDVSELLQLETLTKGNDGLFEIENEFGGCVDIRFNGSSRYSNFSSFQRWIEGLSGESRIPTTHRVASTLVYMDDMPCDNVFYISINSDGSHIWTLYVDDDDHESETAHLCLINSKPFDKSLDDNWRITAGGMLDSLLRYDDQGQMRSLEGSTSCIKAIDDVEWQEQMESIIERLYRQSWIKKLAEPPQFDRLVTIRQNFPLNQEDKATAIKTLLSQQRDSISNQIDFDAYFWESLDEPYRKIHEVNGEEFIDGICYFLTLKLELEHHLSNGAPPFSRWKLASCQDFMGLKGGIDEVFAQMTVIEQILLQGQY